MSFLASAMIALARSSLCGPFDDHDIVLEIDGQRRVRGQNQIDSVRQLLRGGGRRRRVACRVPREVGGRVGLHIRDADVENGEVAFFYFDRGGKLHAAEILIAAVVGLHQRVAEHRRINPGLDAVEHVLRVDVTVHFRFVGRSERHDRVFLPAHGSCRDGGAAIRGFPQEAVRRHPQVHLCGPRRIGAEDDGLRRAGRQPATTAIGRDVGENPVDTPRGRIVIDGSGVGLFGERRPRSARVHSLSESEFRSRPGVLNRFQIVGAHGFGRVA